MKRRSLGQHYLKDPDVARKIVELAAIRSDERVLEIGTGRGILTAELVKTTDSLEAFEIDYDNYRATKKLLDSTGLRLRFGDAFRRRPRFDVLVSSLPYSESSTFVDWLGQADYDRAIVILQDDFVEKIAAEPGERNYRAVSVIAQMSAEVSPRNMIPRDAFEPPPRVNSRLVLLTQKRRLTRKNLALTKLLFSLRRKKLRAALKKIGYETTTGGRLEDMRVNSLTPEQVHRLINSVKPTSAVG